MTPLTGTADQAGISTPALRSSPRGRKRSLADAGHISRSMSRAARCSDSSLKRRWPSAAGPSATHYDPVGIGDISKEIAALAVFLTRVTPGANRERRRARGGHRAGQGLKPGQISWQCAGRPADPANAV